MQPGVEILNLTPSMNTLSGADTDVYVQVGITHPSYNNAQLWQVQSVQAGRPRLRGDADQQQQHRGAAAVG